MKANTKIVDVALIVKLDNGIKKCIIYTKYKTN